MSASANRFELKCEPKRLMLLYDKICPCTVAHQTCKLLCLTRKFCCQRLRSSFLSNISEKPKKFGKRKSPEKRRNDHSNKEGTSGILNISNSQPSTAENSFEILSSKRNSKSPKSDLDIDPKLGYFEDKLGSKRKISEKDRDDLSLRRSKKKKHR